MSDRDLAFAPALEQARMVREKEVSPVELAGLYLQRIDELNQVLGAYIQLKPEQTMDWARDAEARLGEGELPAFHGVPISVKDNVNLDGWPTSHGVASWKDRVAQGDAGVVKKIKDAGFVILGKTNLPELATTGFTEHLHGIFPVARNPWNTDRTTGGSSGGAACAVAAALCPIAEGSDGGGSIRLPSSWCGVYGFKPARGRVSRSPAADNLYSIYGPIARTVADAAALLDVMQGYTTGDAFWAPPPERPFLEEASREPGKLRIAFRADHENEAVEMQPEVRAGVEEAAKLLESLGHEVVADHPVLDPLKLPRDKHPVFSAFASFISALADQYPPYEELDPINQIFMDIGKTQTVRDVMMAEITGHLDARRLIAFWDNYDVLLTPSFAKTAPKIGAFRDPDDQMGAFMKLLVTAPFTGTWNMTGQPACVLPWGFDADGLPLSIQLIGRPADEATLIRLSGQLEGAKPWIGDRPPTS